MKPAKSCAHPIVMLHGWAAHKNFFDKLRPYLPTGLKIAIPDFPGHGENKSDLSCRSIGDVARWLDDYFIRKNIQQPIILGWSMGALVALEYVKLFGEERCKGLVLLDMTPCVLNDENWQLGLLGGLNAKINEKSYDIIIKNWPGYCQGMLLKFFALGSDLPEVSSWVLEEMLKNDPQSMAYFWDSMTQQDYRSLLPEISLPSLILSGGKSALYSYATAKYFADSLQNAALVVCDQSGHALHMEEPKKVAESIVEFCSSID